MIGTYAHTEDQLKCPYWMKAAPKPWFLSSELDSLAFYLMKHSRSSGNGMPYFLVPGFWHNATHGGNMVNTGWGRRMGRGEEEDQMTSQKTSLTLP